MPRIILLIFSLLLLCSACKRGSNDYNAVATFTETGVQAIIEIPAGSNAKIEYNKESGKFEMEQIKGMDRMIDFLPYPGNYGFIPHTLMDTARGGDGDALDVLVLSASLNTGALLEVWPIAALMLLDNGKIDTKIIAVPADSTLRIIHATDFLHFSIQYFAAKEIIQSWFLNYKGVGKTALLGWRDEKYAVAEIKKRTQKQTK